MSQWDAVKRTWKMAKSLKKQRGGVTFAYFLDAIQCGYRHEASPENYLVLRFFEIKDEERSKYLTSGRSKRADKELNRFMTEKDARVMAQKHLFYQMFTGFVKREYLYTPEADFAECLEFMDRHEVFICKPDRGIMGHGVKKIRTSEIRDRYAWFQERKKEKCLIEELIVQNEELQKINDGCVNSVRINAARDKKGNVRLIGACLKCGGKGAVADNFHSGGIAYPVDTDSGCITGPGRNNSDIREYDRHPGSEVVMPGFQIPYWEDIRAGIFLAMERMPNVGYVGWDIAVTPDGFELIEGNCHWPGGNIIQLDRVGKYPLIQECLEGVIWERRKTS